jgi:putative membrane protein
MNVLIRITIAALAICSASASDIAPPLDAIDRDFAEKANQGGLFEIRSSELAIKRGMGTSDNAVAQQMIDDHTAANLALGALAAKKGVTLSAIPDRAHQALIDQLGTVTDKQFAKAYLAQQLKAHTSAIALFSDESTGGRDSDMRTFAGTTLPTLRIHLAHVMNAIDKE